MIRVVEFHGRLPRADNRPANPGKYDLMFRMHASVNTDNLVWSETLSGVEVRPGGFFNVVLGQSTPLVPSLFSRPPLWLAIQVVRRGKLIPEQASRIPVMGSNIQMSSKLEAIDGRLKVLENGGAPVQKDVLNKLSNRFVHIKEWVEEIQERITTVEDSDLGAVLHRRLDVMDVRIKLVDQEGGRLEHIEDELEDLIGPHGDVIDLNERMDFLEGKAPDLLTRLRQREQSPQDRFELLRKQVNSLDQAIHDLAEDIGLVAGQVNRIIERPETTPDGIGAVNRRGDIMTGGLTINRGGLEVLSGGVTCRGANVTTLEAALQVKAPKLIGDAIELRGDLTVDNTRRALQVRMIEGRQGSARKDGALHLNTRGGNEVVVGNESNAKGMRVHGPSTSHSVVTQGSGFAQVFNASGSPKTGDVVRIYRDGSRVNRSSKAADPAVIGVVTRTPGVMVGSELKAGRVAVAVAGVVRCRVDASDVAIAPGDLLISSNVAGCARAIGDLDPKPGAILGKALGSIEKGEGEIDVLLGAR